MKKLSIIFFLILILFATNIALANEHEFIDSFESYKPGNLNEQGGWEVTNYHGDSRTTAHVAATNPDEKTNIVEIASRDSITVTRELTPADTGVFQFRMRHNKSGLFYFNALTSDAGGQLLFSIQFTESNGILLEKANEQIALLPDYNADQWYLFTIDFDNNRGERGTFKIKIDDGNYSEYEYVDSESVIFDFAQIVFGSESNEGTAISAFGGAPQAPAVVAEEIIDENTATTSISADLNNGETVTASIDGVVVEETSPIAETETSLSQTAAVVEADSGILDTVVETFLDIIGVNDPVETTPTPEEPTGSAAPETAPTSSVTGDTSTNATTTTTF